MIQTISSGQGSCGCFGGCSKVVCLSQLSPVYAGRTCGLCGNYNGNQGDDFLTPAGLVEPLVEHFGNAWKLHGDCEDLRKQPTDPCSLNPRLSMCARGRRPGGPRVPERSVDCVPTLGEGRATPRTRRPWVPAHSVDGAPVVGVGVGSFVFPVSI